MSVPATFNVIKGGSPAFRNPAASSINATSSAGLSAQERLETDLAEVNAKLEINPQNAKLLSDKAELEQCIVRMDCLNHGTHDDGLPPAYFIAGGTALSFGAIMNHTNYFSGVSSVPPAGMTDSNGSFVNILASASAMGTISKELGTFDPSDPCAKVNALLGSILGKMAEVLGPLLDVLNTIVNGLYTLMELAALLDNLVANIGQLINDEILRLQEYMATLATYALAQFLNHAIGNPCLAAVLNVIGSSALKSAIYAAPEAIPN